MDEEWRLYGVWSETRGVPSHPLSENIKHSFPENGYECFFVYIKKEEKMESEKIKAGVRLILEGLVKT